MAPKIKALATEQDTLQQMLKASVDLGVQHDAWAQLLVAINDKIPSGVWITELVPVSNPAGGAASPTPSPGPGTAPAEGIDPSSNAINMLVISGLYHANAKTEMVDSARLREFVNSLADLPYFVIDKNNLTETMPGYGGDPNSFAQKFTMRLKLKTPLVLKPDANKPVAPVKPGVAP